MNDLYKYYAEQKTPDTKKFILYDSIFEILKLYIQLRRTWGNILW